VVIVCGAGANAELDTATRGQVVEDFEVHLKNKAHCEKVASRQAETR